MVDYQPMIDRHLHSTCQAALGDTPVILLAGARQTGKSTLAKQLAGSWQEPMPFLTLDDPATLGAAKRGPDAFLEDAGTRCLIDEVQRAPELFLPMKKRVDAERLPGRYLLTGSANVLTLPKIADSLAGRMEVQVLWPFSQGELNGTPEGFVDACFGTPEALSTVMVEWPEFLERVVRGGYPEVVQRSQADRRRAWWEAYLKTLLERDVRDLANIEGLHELPRLLSILAARTGGLQNFAEVGRLAGISTSTLKRYVALLRAMYLHLEIPGWHRNLEKRLIKAPKTYLNDSGLICHLRGVDAKALSEDRNRAGAVVENFVAMELVKQISWSKTRPTLHHFRDVAGNEVDFVMEAPDGRIVGIEVKCSSDLGSREWRGLETLASLAGRDFVRGIILYTGQQRLASGKNLLALPLASLWKTPMPETKTN
jgi:predicted AAA+ superfamily ATPase